MKFDLRFDRTLVQNREEEPQQTPVGLESVEKRAMSKDTDRVLWADVDPSSARPSEAQLVSAPPVEGRVENGKPSESPPPPAFSSISPVDLCLQRAIEAGTMASESDSPEAWRDVISAVAVLSDMARTREVVAEIKQTARQLTQAAHVAERLALEAVDTATAAMQKAEQIEAVAARASEANSAEAWKEAHQMVMALTTTQGTAHGSAR